MHTNRRIILLIFLVVTCTLAGYIFMVVIPSRLAEKSYAGAKQIGEDLRKAFQITPEITVNNTVVLQQQTPVMELATVTQKFRHEYVWENQWAGSTKKITIKGTFVAKAGFDLNKKFRVDITGSQAVVTLPPPQLLSLTSQGDVTFEDENGLWNWIDTNDRTRAMNAFLEDARRFGETADFVADAQKTFESRVDEIFQSHGKTATVLYTNTVSLSQQ